jgi:hypothetical protein
MKWFRLYNEIIDDPKVAKLTDGEFRLFIYLMCVASESEKMGKIDMNVDQLAWRLRKKRKKIEQTVSKLTHLGILEVAGDVLIFVNWQKRQRPSDSSTERVQRHRKRKSNGDVTLQEPLQERHGNALEQNRADKSMCVEKNETLHTHFDPEKFHKTLLVFEEYFQRDNLGFRLDNDDVESIRELLTSKAKSHTVEQIKTILDYIHCDEYSKERNPTVQAVCKNWKSLAGNALQAERKGYKELKEEEEQS